MIDQRKIITVQFEKPQCLQLSSKSHRYLNKNLKIRKKKSSCPFSRSKTITVRLSKKIKFSLWYSEKNQVETKRFIHKCQLQGKNNKTKTHWYHKMDFFLVPQNGLSSQIKMLIPIKLYLVIIKMSEIELRNR